MMVHIIGIIFFIGKIFQLIASILFLVLSAWEWKRLRDLIFETSQIRSALNTAIRSDIRYLTDRIHTLEETLKKR